MPCSVPSLIFFVLKSIIIVEGDANLHISLDIYSPHAVGHVHSHNTLNPLSSHVSGIFHTRTVGEVYYPSHRLQQLEAAFRTIVQKSCRENEEQIREDH